MGIIGVPQIVNPSASKGEDWALNYQRTYRVFSTTDVDEHYVISNLGVDISDTHPSNTAAFVKNIDLRLEVPGVAFYDSGNNPGGAETPPANGTHCYVWAVTIDYGPKTTGTNEFGDPTLILPEVSYGGVTTQEIADGDIDDVPILNTAFDKFDPPVMMDKTRPVIKVTRKEASYSGFAVAVYSDKINENAIGSYPARTLKCGAPIATPEWNQYLNAIIYKVEYQFFFNEKTWDAIILNQGRWELNPSDPTKKRQILIEGKPTDVPVFLDEDGFAMVPPIDETNAVYIVFERYETLDFATAFNFPTGTFS